MPVVCDPACFLQYLYYLFPHPVIACALVQNHRAGNSSSEVNFASLTPRKNINHVFSLSGTYAIKVLKPEYLFTLVYKDDCLLTLGKTWESIVSDFFLYVSWLR